jgi:hypothetical protein
LNLFVSPRFLVMKLVRFQRFIMFEWFIVVNVIQWLIIKLVIRHTLFSRRWPYAFCIGLLYIFRQVTTFVA